MITAACIVLSVVVSIIVAAVVQEKKRAAEESFAILSDDVARRRSYDPVSGERREPAIVAWTPEERHALGLDDNEKFIRETNKVLNDIEWQRIGGHTPKSALPVGVVEVGPGEAKPVYSFVRHDQGEPVIL